MKKLSVGSRTIATSIICGAKLKLKANVLISLSRKRIESVGKKVLLIITDDILLAAGYKTYPDIWKKADTFFQKRVYGETSTRYFINIYKYVYDHRTSYEVDLQFDNSSNRPHWIKFRVMDDDTVETIEQYVENIFTAGNFVDYEYD